MTCRDPLVSGNGNNRYTASWALTSRWERNFLDTVSIIFFGPAGAEFLNFKTPPNIFSDLLTYEATYIIQA